MLALEIVIQRRSAWRVLLVAAIVGTASSAVATTVSIDTSAARAMLSAIDNPRLTLDQANVVVKLHGNQAIIAKLREFGIAASDGTFSRALYEVAHGQAITDKVEKSYFLDIVKENEGEIRKLIDQIDHDPSHFQKAIEARIAMFTPSDATINLQGFVIAGGDGGGYAFGGTDFYLNVGLIRDFTLARAITNHEMYHAVQGHFAKDRKVFADNPDGSACGADQKLFDKIYEEGSAVVVEDQSLVAQSHGEIALRKQKDLADGVKHVDVSSSLLEMSVDAFAVKSPMKFHDVYAVGFYGHGILYDIGYVMAKALVADRGPDALAKLLEQPSSQFVLTYTALPHYGKDDDHPRLGDNTIAAAQRVAAGCK